VSERREPLLATDPPAATAGIEAPPPRSAPRRGLGGPLASAALHLAALFLLLSGWPVAAPVENRAIPIKLVFEPPPKPKPQPQPTPKPAPKMEKPPPHEPLASDDFGAVEPQETSPDKTAVTATPAAPKPSELPKPAPAAPPPPTPTPAPAEPSAPPEPAAAAIPLPPPKPAAPNQETAPLRPLPKPRPPARRGDAAMRLAGRPARYPGPAATRDEYLHYVNMLILRHLDLLPHSAIANRRGVTIIGITVLDNGTLAMLRVTRSSGYPDLDRRVEQMVAAAGRFPPLPQWFQGIAMPLEFEFTFHEGLAR
jgi:TonB family protein